MQVTTKYRFIVTTLGLATFGIALIGVANLFHKEVAKIEIDRLVAEVGALLLVVGILHALFEFGLRGEMLREVSKAVVGDTVLHDSGLNSCEMNSRLVDERAHWTRAATLAVGFQYSPGFFKDYHEVLKTRCAAGLPTTVTVMTPDGVAATYLRDSKTGLAKVAEGVNDIRQLLAEADTGTTKRIRLFAHDRILRYSYIRTDEFVWIKFFTNSPDRALVPAFKVRAGTPLFEFFSGDIKRLQDLAHAVV